VVVVLQSKYVKSAKNGIEGLTALSPKGYKAAAGL
jgi:hypothetical protein